MNRNCAAITCKGNRCRLSCKSKSVFCATHTTMCKHLLVRYKNVCNQVWSKRCFSDMSDAELDKIIDLGYKCAQFRAGFSGDCCGGQYDEGHLGAIQKMDTLVQKCLEAKSQKYLREKYGM